MNDIEILYTDPVITVAVKPPAVLSQPDMTGAPAMTFLVEKAVGHPVFPVHRLDRAVGGIMVFAGNAQATASLNRQIAEGKLQKEYLAMIHGTPEKSVALLEDHLYHDVRRNITQVTKPDMRGAKYAALNYRVIEKKEKDEEVLSLLLVLLQTGRTHQIRVQLASRGLPLVGDSRYGVHDRSPIGLWAFRLSFSHPRTQKRMIFEALPNGEPFAGFDFSNISSESHVV